jgi:hypothetical protein
MSESTALTIACYAGIIALSAWAIQSIRRHYREQAVRRLVRTELKKNAELRLLLLQRQQQRQRVHGAHLTANWPTKGGGEAA